MNHYMDMPENKIHPQLGLTIKFWGALFSDNPILQPVSVSSHPPIYGFYLCSGSCAVWPGPRRAEPILDQGRSYLAFK